MSAGPSCTSRPKPDLDLTYQAAEDEIIQALEQFCTDTRGAADSYRAGKRLPGGESDFISRRLTLNAPLLEAVHRFKNALAYLHGYGRNTPSKRVCELVEVVCGILSRCVGETDGPTLGELRRRIRDWEDFLKNDRESAMKDVPFGDELNRHFASVVECLFKPVRAAIINREAAIADGVAKNLSGAAASPVPIGGGFPFITWCDPDNGLLRMRELTESGQENDIALEITGKRQWHYALQFVRAKTSRIRLKPYVKGKRERLGSVFRNGKDHQKFYRFTRAKKGSNPVYWLEQTQTYDRPK